MLQCVKKQLFFSTMMTQSWGGKEIKNNLLSMHTHTPTASKKLLELEEKALVLCPVRHQEEFC